MMPSAAVPSASTSYSTSHSLPVMRRWRSYFQSARRVPAVSRASGSPNPPGPDGEPPKTPINALEATIRRKQRELETTIRELGMEALDERLQSATQMPLNPPYRLSTLIAESVPQGRAVLVFEVARSGSETTTADLAELAKAYVTQGGASALVVRTDSEATPSGLRDLFTVQQAVPRVPVLARDWLIHPLQVRVCMNRDVRGSQQPLNIEPRGMTWKDLHTESRTHDTMTDDLDVRMGC
ncbi:hypothetical protein Vafri_7208 [Volvox africanus]|uniref:Uncharacterized protein n=1 Tax=Volvox africanus TaxID=51714 RepID=A0A8J4B4B0_9CHLO|nr:hypothetical protein Vafri_7208 [Volvox africanus]